jgi:hydrogenase/urease accessory protein HupE
MLSGNRKILYPPVEQAVIKSIAALGAIFDLARRLPLELHQQGMAQRRTPMFSKCAAADRR